MAKRSVVVLLAMVVFIGCSEDDVEIIKAHVVGPEILVIGTANIFISKDDPHYKTTSCSKFHVEDQISQCPIAVYVDVNGNRRFSEIEDNVNIRGGSLPYLMFDVPFGQNGTFSEGLARTRLGYINKNGEVVLQGIGSPGDSFESTVNVTGLPPVGSFIWAGRIFSQGLVSGSDGYVDKMGKLLIPVSEGRVMQPFSEGLAPVSSPLQWVFVNKKGRRQRLWGYLDIKGHWVMKPKYDMALPFSEGLAAVLVEDKWGYIDKNGDFIIPPKFKVSPSAYRSIGMLATPSMFSEGRAIIWDNKTQLCGYIDTSGEWVIQPTYAQAGNFSSGLAPVRRNGEDAGYIDKSGNYIIDPEYLAAGLIVDNYAAVRVDGVDGEYIIGKSGYLRVSSYGSRTSVRMLQKNIVLHFLKETETTYPVQLRRVYGLRGSW